MTQLTARVLLVDDDADTLMLYALALSSAGLEVNQAASGEAALASVRELPPDVVVTDLTLPDVDGVELCAALRATAGPRLAGLIVLSGTSDDEQQRAAREAGATQVIVKPCLPGDLEQVIRKALESQTGR